MHIYTAAQQKLIDKELYENDIYFKVIYDNYPNVANWLLANLTIFFRNIELSYLVVNYILFIIFWIGCYILGSYVFKKSEIGIIFAIICSYGVKVHYSDAWGIVLGIVSTKDFVTAFIPYILYLYFRYINNPLILSAIFFLTGLLSNIHPITGLACFAVIIFAYFLQKMNIKTIVSIIIYTIVFVIGALPLLLKGLTISTIIPPLEILYFRIGGQYMFFPFLFFSVLLIPCILSFIYFQMKNNKNITLNTLLISSIIFFVFSVISSFMSPFFAPFQFVRSLKLIIPFLYLPSAFVIYTLWRKKQVYRIIAIVLILVLMIPPNYVMTIITPTAMKMNIDFRGTQNNILQQRMSDLTRIYSVDSLFQVSNWIDQNTPNSAILLINPYIASVFRPLSKRSIVLSYKDGGNLILARNSKLLDWYEDIKIGTEVYLTNDTVKYIDYAVKHNADYIIIERNHNNLNLPIVFSSEDFIVYDVNQFLNQSQIVAAQS
ncbi:MAG: DUF6798 domain-containing protein [archaeon]